MAYVTSKPAKFYTEEIEAFSSVSEEALLKIAATSNFILDNFSVYDFGVSGGVYSGLSVYPYIFNSNLEIVTFKCQIEKLVIYNGVSGISGTTQFRIDRLPAGGGSWVNIFSTDCSISNTANDDLLFESTDVVVPSGVTMPVLSTTQLDKNDKLRFVLVSAAGQAKDISVKVITRPVE